MDQILRRLRREARCWPSWRTSGEVLKHTHAGCKGSADGTSDSPGKRGNSFPLAQAIAVSPCCDRIQWPSRRAPTTLWQGMSNRTPARRDARRSITVVEGHHRGLGGSRLAVAWGEDGRCPWL